MVLNAVLFQSSLKSQDSAQVKQKGTDPVALSARSRVEWVSDQDV